MLVGMLELFGNRSQGADATQIDHFMIVPCCLQALPVTSSMLLLPLWRISACNAAGGS